MSIAISMTISMTIISIAGLSISGPLAIISMVSITISISWLSSGSWLSISGPLAIISMVTIAISMTISKTISIITISRLGFSGPLAIVSMVAISISMSIAMAI